MPDRFPLRPLTESGWGSWGAVRVWWDLLGEGLADQLAQLVGGEEVDVQTGLGAGPVADCETGAGSAGMGVSSAAGGKSSAEYNKSTVPPEGWSW